MPYYEYETIPSSDAEEPMLFEIKQSMSEAVLTHHPETGQPVRKVYSGFNVGSAASTTVAAPASGGSSCCGGSCGCHH